MTDERAMEVTQADRELAARNVVLSELRDLIRAGRWDDHETVQAAAKHRTNAVQARDAEICAWMRTLPWYRRSSPSHIEAYKPADLADAIERGDV